MIRVEKSTFIAATVRFVFAFMDDPHNQPDITPSMRDVTDVRRLPNGGITARHTYVILGVPLRGEVRATEYLPNERIEFQLMGGITGRIWWVFRPEGQGTRFTYGAEYAVNVPLFAALTRPLIRAHNEREVDRILTNLRNRLETAGADTPTERPGSRKSGDQNPRERS